MRMRVCMFVARVCKYSSDVLRTHVRESLYFNNISSFSVRSPKQTKLFYFSEKYCSTQIISIALEKFLIVIAWISFTLQQFFAMRSSWCFSNASILRSRRHILPYVIRDAAMLFRIFYLNFL